MDFRALLASEFGPYRVLSPEQLDVLASHYELLLKWNQTLNLWRVKAVLEAVRLHYCESLYLGLQLPQGELRIADVGSGAGFPGFPIGIIRPECAVTLIESDRRKAAFLREAAHGVLNIRIYAGRAEDVGERYDWIVSRAVRRESVRNLRLAPSVALLTGEVSEIKVPWGERRFIDMFHVKL
jgi:16S rRNA (guanine527-N7)-methyltransferase